MNIIPLSIGHLTKLRYLGLHDNDKLEVPPKSLVNKVEVKEILHFLRDCEEGIEKWKQLKLITIGHEGAGKVIFIFTNCVYMCKIY